MSYLLNLLSSRSISGSSTDTISVPLCSVGDKFRNCPTLQFRYRVAIRNLVDKDGNSQTLSSVHRGLYLQPTKLRVVYSSNDVKLPTAEREKDKLTSVAKCITIAIQ